MLRINDTRERLLEAALELIWGQSYGATSVDAICERADVKKGSFYHFFKSKSELAIAAFEADWFRNKPRFDAIFSPAVPPLQRLLDAFDFALERQTELKKKCGHVLGCPLHALGSEVGTQDPAIREKMDQLLATKLKYFESAIRDAHAQGQIKAPDAKAKTIMLFSCCQGMLTQARIENDLGIVRDMKHVAMDLLGAGQLTRPELATA